MDPDRAVKSIVVPPPRMVANMKVGTMDAFRVGEPWNDQLVNQGLGCSACVSAESWKDHPETSLAMRSDWVTKNLRAAEAITAAVIKAQIWADSWELIIHPSYDRGGLDPIFPGLRTVPPLAWLPLSLAAFRDAKPSAIFVIFVTAT